MLNARTDAFVKAGDRDPADVLADAVERGRAFLDAGASTFFVPGKLDEPIVSRLVEELGPQKVNSSAIPGRPTSRRSSASGSPGCPSGPGARTSP